MKTIMCNLLMAAVVMSVDGCKYPFAKDEKILSYDVKIGSKSTVTPVPNAVDWWMPRHKAIVKRVAQGNVDMIMIGDSITHWWENAGKTVWNKYYSDRNAVNMGFSGDQTQHVLWRLNNGEIGGIKPKLAVIMIGTNNSGVNNAQDIADGIIAICQKLRKDLPHTKILLLAIFPRADIPEQMPVINKTNEIIKNIADNKHIYFLNINEKFLEPDGTLSKNLMPDLLHPNENGYEIWANTQEPMIKKLMKSKPSKYYISSSSGNDSNKGSSPTQAWKTFDKLNAIAFSPGDEIYLKRSDSWDQTLTLRGSGSPDQKILLDAYGDGNKPLIKRTDITKDTCVYAKDISNWTIKNLDMRNALRGLHLEYFDANAHNMQINGCDFYDMNYTSQEGKIVGIGLNITGAGKDTLYDPVIKNCNFIRCVNGLAINVGTQNLICEDCFASKGLSAGFALVNVRNSIVRHFVAKDLGGYLPYGVCAGFVVWCDGVTIDNCEFTGCTNGGGHDGVGFDFEGNSKNMIFTNNLIHDNEGAGIMVMSTSGHNSNILIKDCTLYNNCKKPSSEKASYEMLCWNDGNTGSIVNCKIFKANAVDYIHSNYSNFTKTGNKFYSYASFTKNRDESKVGH